MGGQNHEIETKTAIPRDWLTIEEAADYFQIKPKTVRKWLYQRELRYYKIGGLVRIRKENLGTFPFYSRH